MDASALKEAKGWIDPCPLWDEDGKAYMVFAYAKSRCGIKHKLSICEISPDAERVLSEPRLVYDGTQTNPTLEGPKLYKRNGWYYIFAPAGGVETGWQTVLRSRTSTDRMSTGLCSMRAAAGSTALTRAAG